jgi:hypothetical protein
MRWPLGACIALGAILGSGCTLPVGDDTAVGSVSSPIAYGSLDTTHTAVVALLSPVGTTQVQECTGSIVGVSGGVGSVLTAAHCCNTYPPTVVVVSSSYVAGEQYISGGTPAPPAYRVVAGSVYYDALYSQDMELDHDFCMLKFAGAPANTATLALPSATDGLGLGSEIEHVGYGQTQNGSNSNRMAGIDTVDEALTPLVIEFSQGGPDATPGTCDGDSGGPSLLPATAAQAEQVVVAVQSYGSNASCADITFGVGSRVSSAMGTGGFIASYLAGAPIGIQAGATSDAGTTADGGSSADAGAPPHGVSASGSGWAMMVLFAGLLTAGLFEVTRRA